MNIRIKTNKREKDLFGVMAFNHFMGEVEADEDERFISGVRI